MSINILEEIPDSIIDQAVRLALEEYDQKTRYMIFGSEYKGEAQAISDLVDKYIDNWKNEAIDRQEQKSQKCLAEHLGITYDEYIEAEGILEEEPSSEGFTHVYRVRFAEDAPREILDKIPSLGADNTVELNPSEVEELNL
ncbi:MAG: hypothetical protein EAZ95_07510 [Bacteroidetes bacterium]|nr:MAG: hypothetical protein EAZ95_07510 [Bacteroidota bacterium]